jgi:uncharacterized protein YyaL (SSP411 family)
MAHLRPGRSPAPGAGRRLADEPSVYLRGAAEQSISWYPWGTEPFEAARREKKPVLLDIGAAWCHWCHVMDEGTYSDPEVARLIEEHFVAVKVDRDERPEVDRRYQRQVGTLTGEGGWPLTAFLTPEGEVFLGGTYFPAEDAVGRPGFRRVLREVARLWSEEPERVRQNADAVREALGRMARAGAPSAALEELVAHVREDVTHRFDPVNGGWGQAPKFPHPTAISFVLADAFYRGDEAAAERARLTLERMADGGMYDQIGGGFHRYSVDEGWHIPHFEKMGVDNAALLDVYVEGARRFRSERFVEVVRETVGWVREVLVDPAGGFGASQDADNAPGDDGSYFTWSRAELKAELAPEELRLVTRFYGVGSDGRMPHDPDRNVLFRLMPLAEAAEGAGLPAADAAPILGRARTKLLRARSRRATPLIDRALYAGINGQFVRAFVHAGRYLGDDAIVADAQRAADRFLQEAYRPGRGIAHRLLPGGPAGFGFLDDQVEFALGLLELAAARKDPAYLRPAEEILETVRTEFRAENGLYRDLAPKLYDGPQLGAIPESSYPLEDTPHLSANAAAALAFLRLAALTESERWRSAARELLAPLSGRLKSAGLFAAGSALAALLADRPALRVVVEGRGAHAEALGRAAELAWSPMSYVFRGHPPPPFSLPTEVGEAASAPARALVCFGERCLAPITEPGPLERALSERPS